MPDEPSPIASASIGDQNTITNSIITQTITHQAPPWEPRWELSGAEAQALLDPMPHDQVPEISTLPPGSRMPFAPNPHFVGRDEVLLELANALYGGERVAIGPKAAHRNSVKEIFV